MVRANRKMAKDIILGILHLSAGGLGKTKLYKAFWLAHLYHTQRNRGYLSDWPIVKMPQGPGIEEGSELLGELSASGDVVQTDEEVGPFREKRCRLGPTDWKPAGLSPEAIDSIRLAVDYVRTHTASQLSAYSHDFSRSWRDSADGAELDIYGDLIPDDEYAANRKNAEIALESYKGLFE